MIKKIGLKLSINTMIILLLLVVIYHLLIIIELIPYDAVWGGRLETRSQMYNYEIVSIIVNLFIMLVISIKASYIKLKIPKLIITIFLWIFVILFFLNSIGNIFSLSLLETIIFTPITLLFSVLCLRLAIDK